MQPFLSAALFENDVNMYGTQTMQAACTECGLFENDVNMYGTQTLFCTASCLC